MENEKLFEFLTIMHSEMKEGFSKIDERFSEIDERFNEIDERFSEVNNRLTKIENTVIKIENEHGKKLQVLFDGYRQHSDQLERIEKEVTKHDEFILKRVK